MRDIRELIEIPLLPEKERKAEEARLVALEKVIEAEELEEGPDASNEFYDAMRRAYDPLTGVPNDVRLDFSDWELAENIYDYVVNKLGKGSKLPFARQFWILYHFTGEYCPRCTDPELEDIYNIETDDDVHELAERAALLKHGVCPKCGSTKSEMILKKELADYTDLVLVLGQRSGKSVLTAVICSYWYHRLLKVPRYSELCSGIQDFTPITGTLVALSFARAIKLLWNPVKEILTHGEWFSSYHERLTEVGKRHGIEFLKFNSLLLNYRHKNLELYPMGPLKRSLRGDTRSLCLVGSTEVLTNKGLLTIDQDLSGLRVVVGGEQHLITHHHKTGKKPVIKITLANYKHLTGSSDHLVLLKESGDLRWAKLGNLKVGQEIACDSRIFQGEIITSPVVSIEDQGVQETFDITVDSPSHAFIANGIFTHNSAVDELGWFPNKVDENEDDNADEANEREFANADEVYAALDNSLATIRIEVYNLYKKGFNHIPTGINLLTSSPSSRKDKIWRLFEDSKESKVMLGLNLPTWEINPAYTRDHPFIEEAYRKNFLKADRDFGANPPELYSVLYTKEAVLPLFNGTQHHSILTASFKIDKRPEQLTGELHKRVERQEWPGTVLAIDGGTVNNSFSFALGHLDQPEDAMPKLHVYTLGEIIPDGTRPISFLQVYQDVVRPLMKQCNVKFLACDRWNSLMLLESAERDFPDSKSMQYTLKPLDFKSFDKDLIETRALSLPELEVDPEIAESVSDYRKAFINRPASHLYLQFRTVTLQGSVPGKGDGFTDDIYRAVVLLATVSRLPKVAAKIRETPLLSLMKPTRVHVITGGRLPNNRRRG